ncbi:MAG: hypothetical protein DYG89_49245 [Caldilinea sp. CFX5]|nr:hypothetical protein [Caldilinea sp. CFX5]
MHLRRPIQQLLTLLLLTIFLTACTLPIRLDPQALKTVSVDVFADQLRTALVLQDYHQLQQLMGSPFIMAGWQAEGKEVPPAVAIVQLRNHYLSDGSAVEVPTKVAWRDLLGDNDPLTLWGPAVPAVKALYVTGLSDHGQDEALLIVAQQPDGAPYWHSMVVAPGGFHAKPASANESTTTLVSTASADKQAALTAASVAPADAFPRLTFNTSATAASVRGVLAAESEQHYLVRALAGQQLMVELASTTGQATFTIRGAEDGKFLKEGSKALKVWAGTAPTTQDYQITVTAPTTTPFELVAHFDPRQAPVAPLAAPTRLVFAAGANTMTVNGTVAAPEQQRYLLRGVAGRTLQITLTAATKGTTFAVQGVTDGKPLKRLETIAQSWSNALPMTQDYLITVTTSGAATEYTLELGIE